LRQPCLIEMSLWTTIWPKISNHDKPISMIVPGKHIWCLIYSCFFRDNLFLLTWMNSTNLEICAMSDSPLFITRQIRLSLLWNPTSCGVLRFVERCWFHFLQLAVVRRLALASNPCNVVTQMPAISRTVLKTTPCCVCANKSAHSRVNFQFCDTFPILRTRSGVVSDHRFSRVSLTKRAEFAPDW
jgi:hypothetical protein